MILSAFSQASILHMMWALEQVPQMRARWAGNGGDIFAFHGLSKKSFVFSDGKFNVSHFAVNHFQIEGGVALDFGYMFKR